MLLSRSPLRNAYRTFYSSVRCLDKEKRPPHPELVDTRDLQPPPAENPISRTGRVLMRDMRKVAKFFDFLKPSSEKNTIHRHVLLRDDRETEIVDPKEDDYIFPEHCDILIIGGGAIGSSCAYWLKEKAKEGLRVVVVEKDKTYSKSSTTLSVGGLRQQFSLEENIQMSLYSADFIRNVKKFLGDHVNINFVPHGYLFLASEAGAQTLQENSILQNRLGARNIILTEKRLKERFPWLNTDGIALGCLGLEKEGWFDAWSLLMGYKHQAQRLGADYVDGEVIRFEFQRNETIQMQGIEPGTYESTNDVIVKVDDGTVRRIKFATCIIAAGANSGEVGRLARIGSGHCKLLDIALPVEPRKRYVYVVQTQGENCPGFNTPLTIDPSGTYLRRDGLGGNFLVGRSPDEEPIPDNLDVDYKYFDEVVWPCLAKRVPAFESAKVVSAWSGFYEYNTFDENGIIGPHPYFHNIFIATGFSGHGIQQSPAVGRAIAEMIVNSEFRTIDLTRLGFDRLVVNERMLEQNIV